MGKLHKDNNYRQVYKEHFGDIPEGYHIHHKDRNPLNNAPENLVAVSPEEHAIIHESEFVEWARIGGKIGGIKCRDEALGIFSPTYKKPKGWSQSKKFCENQSKRLKEEYRTGKRQHWTKKFDKDDVSRMISEGDPGKGQRGKPSKNRGKKLTLSNPELARKRKSNAAKNRKKQVCPYCSDGKLYDAGNLKQHIRAKHKDVVE